MPRHSVAIGVAVLLVAGFGVALFRAQRLPEGPRPIAWDKEVCARCHMHIGDPRFAAQLQTEEGKVLDFDDPGCLLAYQADQSPRVHALWFHSVREDRWIAGDRVAFVEVPDSPMGYDLGAVEVGTPGSISLDEARRRVSRREGGAR